MPANNIIYAQSGGVTPVINATAGAVIEAARAEPRVGKVLAGADGILGVLKEDLIDTGKESRSAVAALRHTPGGAFGSCRYKLKGLEESRTQYERLIEVFAAHDVGYFFYNGGGDSADTAYKVSQIGDKLGFPVKCIGIPKTVDNDLPITDVCPGFGSVAKYIAVSTLEASLDVMSMYSTSTRVFILEVMGRHAGWIAAAGGLAGEGPDDPPQVILFPEVAFDRQAFLKRVDASVTKNGYCTVVVSEGARYADGTFLADAGSRDAFGHVQLGGAALVVKQIVSDELGHKCHWAVSDYLQRSARHIASRVDVEQASAVGRAAVEFAAAGKSGVMPVIERTSDKPYRWKIAEARLSRMANREKSLPKKFIGKNGFGITPACRKYLEPLIQGEAYPPYTAQGLPKYVRLNNARVAKKLEPYEP